MKQLTLVLSLLALLAGCADQPPKDAVIEDRGIRTATGTGMGAGADTQGVAMAAVDAKPIMDGTSGQGAGAVGAGADAQKVQTHALADAATEVKSLDGSPVPGSGAAGGAGEGAAAGGSNQQAAIALSLKDLNSPLSKRVILFDYDSSAIRDEYRTLLEAHSEYLKSNPASKVILQGHADERGSREYNLALGQRRSESVFKAMSLLGVADMQMEAVSLGEEKPVAEGHDEEAWQQNRRTEILYHGE